MQGLANIDVFMQSTINTGWLKINLLPLQMFMLPFKIFDLFLRQSSQEQGIHQRPKIFNLQSGG